MGIGRSSDLGFPSLEATLNDQTIPPEEHSEASPSSLDEAAFSSDLSSESPESILKTHDLSLSYGSHRAVDHLNLNVNRGEIYGFLGRNGAGKTSTIRMIMGICRPDSGTIEFNGKQLRRIGKLEKQKIGYVSQEQFFYTWMTCRRIGKFVGGLYPTWNADEFNRLLSAFDLPENRRISQLSGGMKVKLALAFSIGTSPRYFDLGRTDRWLRSCCKTRVPRHHPRSSSTASAYHLFLVSPDR